MFAADNSKWQFLMFWKKKKQDDSQSKIILGMVMLQDENSFDLDSFFIDYKNNYDNTIADPTGDNSSVVFKIDNELIAIGHMPVPIPIGDIQETAKYAYNWQTAIEDLKTYKSHLIVSVINGGQNQIKRFKIFTQVICSLLRTTNSPGVYKGSQSLLIPKEDYLNEALLMSEKHLPLNLWIYFGLRVSDKGNGGYTYGLSQFDKNEMEIINSSKSAADIREFLLNVAHYVLDKDVTFKDGQTCGVTEDQIISITFSKGKFVKGDTFKLAY